MSHTAIKICGITNVSDALIAVQAGADFLGLIFVKASPRHIELSEACNVATAIRAEAKQPVKLVGVFQNHAPDEVRHIIQTANLDLVQLHGQESPEYCRAMPVPVIKTIVLDTTLTEADLLHRIEQYQPSPASNITALLVDLPKQAFTPAANTSIVSTPIPASVIKRLRSIYWLAAGGLNPDNIKDAIQQFSPNGVDVASGVERLPGKKDPAQVQRFCDNVRTAQVNTESLGETPSCNH